MNQASQQSNGHAHTDMNEQEQLQQQGAGGPSSAPSQPPVPHIRIVPHLDAPRSLHFEVVDKDVPQGFVLKIGRFTDKQALPNRVTFKSKVVSRGHAEIYTDQGKFYIRDTKSSSGTFLNHARLSPPGVESKPTQLKDGDVIQLGVDYQGGTQEIYRCVKMRLELNRSWQQQANPFRTNTLKAIRSLTTANTASSTDCCICLFRIASFQSLFVAPCSHVYHYKCIRPLLMAHHPGFQCPLCRTFADLEDSVEIDDPIEEEVPVEEAVAAIERATNAQESVPENALTPAPPMERPPVDSLAEEAYAPTPPSEQAHTFQPPDNDSYPPEHPPPQQPQEAPLNHEHQPIQGQEVLAEIDQSPAPIPADDTPGHVFDHEPTLLSPNTFTPDSGASPMDIEQPLPVSTGASSSSFDSPVQQSPSSSFFMAPSPPNFAPNQRSGSIPFGSPSSSSQQQQQQQIQQQQQQQQGQGQEQHATISPSNHVTSVLSNFVRNISIPTRNRSRTNSNSPLNPMVQNGSTGTSSGHIQIQGNGVQGESHTDVFGKTLVVTPPPMTVNQARNTNTGNGNNDGSLPSYYQPIVETGSSSDDPMRSVDITNNDNIQLESDGQQDHDMDYTLQESRASRSVEQQPDHEQQHQPLRELQHSPTGRNA